MKKLSLILTCCLIGSLLAQQLDAPIISEWKNPKSLGIEYKYHSISVHVVNGGAIPDLYSGANLTKADRTLYGLKKNDYAKYIYLYLEVPNPKKTDEIFTLPLYFLDARDKNNVVFKGLHSGKVLDKLQDDDLDYKELAAMGKIKVIKGNKANELMADVLSISNDILQSTVKIASSPFGIGSVSETLNKANSFFKKIAVDKTVNSEFVITLLNESDYTQYELTSVTVHQIKYEKMTKQTDPLTTFHGKEQTLDEIKQELGKNKDTYLIVARYKSYYVLPADLKTTVEIDQGYLDKRLKKITDFYGMKRDAEELFLKSLKEAISISEDYKHFNRSKENNIFDLEALSRIINSYYLIKTNFKEELSLHVSNSKRKEYYEDCYRKTYLDMFNKIDIFFTGEAANAKRIVDEVCFWDTTDINKISVDDICLSHMSVLNYYRDLIEKGINENKSVDQIRNSIFYSKFINVLKKLEEYIVYKVFVIPDTNIDGKIAFINKTIETYKCCYTCKETGSLMINDIKRSNDDMKRKTFVKWQEAYLPTIQCWIAIRNVIADSLNLECPIDTSTKAIGTFTLCDEYQKHYQGIQTAITDYKSISNIKTESLSSILLLEQITKYEVMRKNVIDAVNHLVKAKIISKESAGCYLSTE